MGANEVMVGGGDEGQPVNDGVVAANPPEGLNSFIFCLQ